MAIPGVAAAANIAAGGNAQAQVIKTWPINNGVDQIRVIRRGNGLESELNIGGVITVRPIDIPPNKSFNDYVEILLKSKPVVKHDLSIEFIKPQEPGAVYRYLLDKTKDIFDGTAKTIGAALGGIIIDKGTKIVKVLWSHWNYVPPVVQPVAPRPPTRGEKLLEFFGYVAELPPPTPPPVPPTLWENIQKEVCVIL